MNDDLVVSNVVAFSDAMTKAGVLKPVLDKLTTPNRRRRFLEDPSTARRVLAYREEGVAGRRRR